MRRIRGREIGAVFQDPLTSLNPLYTIGRQLIETITTHLDLSAAGARARALDLLAEVGISAPERRFDHYPHQFSGGMRQRVVIALALAAKPKLIIADEPTTALDVSIQAQIIALLKRLCRDHGTAVMLITHDMGVIAETADRVAVMYAGRIVEIGPVADVIHHPQHPYTRGLMGSIPSIVAEREQLAQIDGSDAASDGDSGWLRISSALSRTSSSAAGTERPSWQRRMRRRRRAGCTSPEAAVTVRRGSTARACRRRALLRRVAAVAQPRDRNASRGQVLRAVDGVSLAHRPGRDAGARRRIGLRQVDRSRGLSSGSTAPRGGEIRFAGRRIDVDDAAAARCVGPCR